MLYSYEVDLFILCHCCWGKKGCRVLIPDGRNVSTSTTQLCVCVSLTKNVFSDSCFSSVGNRRVGKQRLSIGRNCDRLGTVEHELLHALGFWHEQSRADRDDYISIMWDQIEPGMSVSVVSTANVFLQTRTTWQIGIKCMAVWSSIKNGQYVFIIFALQCKIINTVTSI